MAELVVPDKRTLRPGEETEVDELMGGRSNRSMPSVDKIIDYWREEVMNDTNGTYKWLKAYYIGFGEPFCFACGWLAPVADGRKDSWRVAQRWLDRAHLQDHALGGSAEPNNLVMMCHLCHARMPEFEDRGAALQWVIDHPNASVAWQMRMDRIYINNTKHVSRTTMSREKSAYLEALMEYGLATRNGVYGEVYQVQETGKQVLSEPS